MIKKNTQDEKLEFLINNAPGALFCCRFDEPLTIVQMSEPFLQLFGYTEEEIASLFQNSFWEMILPEDRDRSKIKVESQMLLGDLKELEYRVIKKDGSVCWILDKGRRMTLEDGQDIFCCVLVDITKGKIAQEDLQLTLERYQIIMDQTNDIVFEWDIPTDSFTVSSNWKNKINYESLPDNYTLEMLKKSHIYPDDIAQINDLVRKMWEGAEYLETEIRLKTLNGEYIWCRLRATPQFDYERKPHKAVGVIIDIDSEKIRAQKLLERAQSDTLTKLYNKGTAQNIIKEMINRRTEGSISALLIIDLDDFKMVNDTMGHLFGDTFLMEMSSEMKKLFRSNDVAGRIGGDEFIIFMDGISDGSIAERKAQQVIECVQSITQKGGIDSMISCSIGIAMVPDHGTTFQDLYRNADYALYNAKKQGKGRYQMYNEQIIDAGYYIGMAGNQRTEINEHIDSEYDLKISGLSSNLVEYIFDILYKGSDPISAIQPILELVGRRFDVNRVYIFENTDDNKYCSNTFEWCDENTSPEMDHLQMISYEEDLEGVYLDNFDHDGVFYCMDIQTLPDGQRLILEAQGIKSILQCAIKDNGVFRGYVGFDDCRIKRFWTKEQISVLTFISKILSIFLMKQRAQDKAIETARALQQILDNQNSWIYVVDRNTYEMYYINKKTRNLVPDAETGMTCYESFFDRTSPCSSCPARNIKEGHNNCTIEVFNPILNVWSLADASLISWQGREACLLCCHDVTDYKK